MEGGQVDRPEVRVDPIPIPPLPFEGAQIPEGKNHQARTSTSPEPRLDVQAAMQSRIIEEAQAHSERCRKRIE